jgi:hypothetical protein
LGELQQKFLSAARLPPLLPARNVHNRSRNWRAHESIRILPVSVTISPIKAPAGEIIGASSIARDISRQKQVENELQMALAERKQLVRKLQDALKHLKAL